MSYQKLNLSINRLFLVLLIIKLDQFINCTTLKSNDTINDELDNPSLNQTTYKITINELLDRLALNSSDQTNYQITINHDLLEKLTTNKSDHHIKYGSKSNDQIKLYNNSTNAISSNQSETVRTVARAANNQINQLNDSSTPNSSDAKTDKSIEISKRKESQNVNTGLNKTITNSTSRTNGTNGYQNPINLNLTKINSKNLEQMSFINSIDKLINLTNVRNNKRSESLNQTIIKILDDKKNDHKNLSSALSHLSSNSKLSTSTNSSSILANNVTYINTTSNTFVPNSISLQTSLPTTAPTISPNILNKLNASNPITIKKRPSLSSTDQTETNKNETKKINQTSINQPTLKTNETNLANLTNHQTEEFKKEKVLVFPVHTNQSNDKSVLSAQSKRAPHYLEEKFRNQLSTTTSPPNRANDRLDIPTPILDTKPLIEEVDNELDLKELNERLISEEALIHHGGSGVEDSSYEYGSHHNPHHISHHSTKHNSDQLNKQDQLNTQWFEQNCLENCTCELDRKWPEFNGQSRKTLNCSNKELNEYPTIINEMGKHVERLILSDNNLKTFQVDGDLFHCEKLIELDLSNNKLQQLTSQINSKHLQHPIVEFHFSHHHKDTYKEDNVNLVKTTNSPMINTSTTISSATSSSITNSTTNSPITTTASTNSTFANRQNLFTHCHKLKILVLSGNEFNTLTTACFRGLKRLRRLYLDNAQIKFVEKNTFLGVNELRLLSLRNNLLTSIHSDMFQHMINLKVLDLTGNSLTYLGVGIFNSLVALQALHLGHNKLRQLNFQCFSGLDGLQLLTINSNQLESVPRFSLQPLKKLKILDLSNNPINRISEDDFSHSFVQLLLLNHLSNLQHVARFAFWDLPYLNELQITHCPKFVHLDEQAIVGTPALHRLRLYHNAISQLDDRLLENLARITIAGRRPKVYLAGNKFLCDCFLKPLLLCARDQPQCRIELSDRENITCSFRKNSTSLKNTEKEIEKETEIYRIDELNNDQLSNECSPSFVPIITPINVTIVKRLRSKFSLYCKALGVPVPNVYWLQPSGEIHKEKLLTRHTHDLMEKDLLTSPHSFQNDDTGLIGSEQLVDQNENQLTNQATAAFLPYTNGALMSTTRLNLPSNPHHGSSTLRISHLTPNDAGLYTCIAENRLGSIRSHVRLITQQLKIDLDVENTSTNFITIKWEIDSIFNPSLSEILGTNFDLNETSASNSSFNLTASTKKLYKIDEALANAKKEQNLLEYQLLYKLDPFTQDDDKQTSTETLGSDRTFESNNNNKFFASYESAQISRQLRSFTIAGLRPGSKYKICVAIREPRLNELELGNSGLFRKRAIRRFRLKRNLISVESANYLAISCLHATTSHAAVYARNILRAEKLELSMIFTTAFGTAIKVGLVFLVSSVVSVLILIAYTWTKQHQRRSMYETPRKTLLSSIMSNTLQANTPRHSNRTPMIPLENINSPLMLARRN